MSDIIDTLTADGSFKTLLSLLKIAGLTDKLHAPGPITLFAPNDAAFERVNLDEITRDSIRLTTLLCYHLVEGSLTSSEIAEQQHLLTDCGKSLSVKRSGGQQFIDNAKLVATDIRCGNGIIHVIDNVFLPDFSGWYCGGCC